MTARYEFNRQLVARRFQRSALAEKDHLWSIALVFGGSRHLAQTILTHGLGNAWKSVSALAETTEASYDALLRREIYFALAQTGLGVLTAKEARTKGRFSPSCHDSLCRVNALRAYMEPEDLTLLALEQYSPLSNSELSILFGLPEDVVAEKITQVRASAEEILRSNELSE